MEDVAGTRTFNSSAGPQARRDRLSITCGAAGSKTVVADPLYDGEAAVLARLVLS
jgi:hypothetical protein